MAEHGGLASAPPRRADAGWIDMALAGEPVRLHGDRALYWPARRRLLLADLHLGKGDAFRSAGIALPSGGTTHDLARLSALVQASGAGSLWVLGDMLHGSTRERRWREGWDAWRARHAGLEVVVLAGNHDRALANAGLGVTLAGEAVDDGPFALRHAPHEHPRLHLLCGHLHPVVRLRGVPRRWPAFWLRPGSTVLPAFSAFTGGWPVAPRDGERLVACVDGAAVPLPAWTPVPGGVRAGS